ncbi:MAG: STE like transcription factor domain protein, partial [bacterium 42_11]
MRKVLIVLLTVFVLLLLIQYNTAFGERKSALVLYDELTTDYSVALVNLLGHFFFEYDTKTEHILRASIDKIKSVDVLFVLSSYNSVKPSGVILEAINSRNQKPEKVTCLIGTPSWLKKSDKYQVFAYVSYKGQHYRGSYGIYPLEIESGHPIAFFDDETKVFISKNGNLWIVQGFPFFGVHSWIFADVLHDILGVQHKPQKSMFLRLEDVNPSYGDAELEKLEKCINYLYSQGVPFAIAVYPVFIDFSEGRVITLLQNEKLVSLLKRAEKMGGSIIMHGTSHQYRIVSGEGS